MSAKLIFQAASSGSAKLIFGDFSPAATRLKYWDGAAFSTAPLKRWDGSDWQLAGEVKYWNSVAWG